MKKYKVTVHFEDAYTKEYLLRTEVTEDRAAAINAFTIYIEHPDTTFCNVIIEDTDFIIASYLREG